MKNKSFISILLCLLSVGFLASSCEDMLTPDMKRYTENYAQDSVYSAFGILKSIQNVAERSVLLDACRSDLSKPGTYTTDSILSISNFQNPEDGSSKLLNVADYYHIINSCNFYLARVDTVSSKNGSKLMMRETAQIQSIRGWAYLQLVKNYGSVPFITTPISSTEVANQLMTSAPKANKDNLVDLLNKSGLKDALTIQKTLHMPSYGSLNNGSTTFSSSSCFIPIQLVLGDAYLIKNDYENAARMYYDYFYYVSGSDNNSGYACSINKNMSNGVATGYSISGSSWLKCMSQFYSDEQLVITIGSANSIFGKMLTEVQHTFGFKTTSSQSTGPVTIKNDDGTTTTKIQTSGAIATVAYKNYQQILPSDNYLSLNLAQKPCYYSEKDEQSVYPDNFGDGRLYGTAPEVQFEDGTRARVIDKFCAGTSSLSSSGSYVDPKEFKIVYQIPLYRKPEIYLRFAEAINRLGYPKLAFGILKDGLIKENFPSLSYHDTNVYVYDNTGIKSGVVVNGDTLLYKDGYSPDSTKLHVPYLSAIPRALSGGMYYLTASDMEKISKYPFLDFYTNDRWSNTQAQIKYFYGIHSRGCGSIGGYQDSVNYTFTKQVANKIAENYARQNNLNYAAQKAYEATLYTGDSLLVSDENTIINAVEDLIVDESALETAFEGHRFTDLLRIKDHKNAVGIDGTNWFAWKVARRAYSVTSDATQKDESLFGKLQNSTYWFFQLPK